MSIMSFSRIDGLVRQYISQPNNMRLKIDDLKDSVYEGNLYLGSGSEPRVYFLMWEGGFTLRAMFDRPRHLRNEMGVKQISSAFYQVYSSERGRHDLDISDYLVTVKFAMRRNELIEKETPFSDLYDDMYGGKAPLCVHFMNDFVSSAYRFFSVLRRL